MRRRSTKDDRLALTVGALLFPQSAVVQVLVRKVPFLQAWMNLLIFCIRVRNLTEIVLKYIHLFKLLVLYYCILLQTCFTVIKSINQLNSFS